MSVSWKEALILGIIPLGQLYARIVNLNGSLDKKWLFIPIFMFPPFQLIATIMMKFGYVKKGKGGKPYDWYILIPIITKILVGFLLEYLGDQFDLSTPLIVLIDVIINLLASLIPFYIRTKKTCKEYNKDNFMNTFVQGSIVEASAEIFSWAGGFIPILGMMISVMEMIPVIGPVIPYSIAYATGYILLNMINNDDPKAFCFKNKYKFFFSIIAILITTALRYFGYVSDM